MLAWLDSVPLGDSDELVKQLTSKLLGVSSFDQALHLLVGHLNKVFHQKTTLIAPPLLILEDKLVKPATV